MAIEIDPPCGQILEKTNPDTKSSSNANAEKMATSVMNNVLCFIISHPSPRAKVPMSSRLAFLAYKKATPGR